MRDERVIQIPPQRPECVTCPCLSRRSGGQRLGRAALPPRRSYRRAAGEHGQRAGHSGHHVRASVPGAGSGCADPSAWGHGQCGWRRSGLPGSGGADGTHNNLTHLTGAGCRPRRPCAWRQERRDAGEDRDRHLRSGAHDPENDRARHRGLAGRHGKHHQTARGSEMLTTDGGRGRTTHLIFLSSVPGRPAQRSPTRSGRRHGRSPS